METKLEGTVNYLQFVASAFDTAEEKRVIRQVTTVARESLFRPTYRLIK